MDTSSSQDLPRLSIRISGENVAVTVEQEYRYQTGFQPENLLYVLEWKTGYDKTVRQTSEKSVILEFNLYS